MDNKKVIEQKLLEQRSEQKEFALNKVNNLLDILNISFDQQSSSVSESHLLENLEFQQIKNLESIKKASYRQGTLAINSSSSKTAKENLEIILFKYYRNYYINKNIYGQILSHNNKDWYPRKNFGNKNYLISTKKADDEGNIPGVAILRDLHNSQLSILWNYFDYFEDRQIRLYENLFVNDDF